MGIELKGTFTDVEAPASGGLLLGTGDMRKDQIMSFIVNFLREKGYCPSIREIGKGVGLRSPSSVYAYMKELAGEGQIVLSGGVNVLMTEVTSLYLPCGRTTLLSVFHIRLFA